MSKMLEKINKKIIIISIVSLTMVLGLLFLLNYYFQRSDKNVSAEYKKIVIDNKWGTTKDFFEEKSEAETKFNIMNANKMIGENLINELDYFDVEKDKTTFYLKESRNLIESQKYYDSLKETRRAIAEASAQIKKYKKSNADNFREIDKKLIGYVQSKGFDITNYRIVDNWAIVTVIPLEIKTEPANIIFEKKNNEWVAVAGPGTSFPSKFLRDRGAPQEIIDKANDISSTDLLK